MFVRELGCDRSIIRGILCDQQFILSFVSGAFIQDTSRIPQTLHITHVRYEQSGVCEQSIRNGAVLGGQSACMSVARFPFEGFSRYYKRELCVCVYNM